MTAYWVSLLAIGLSWAGQKAPPAPAKPAVASRLLTGKLIYVGPMPDALDRWIIEDLRGWGKYTPTRESEGADLALRASVPEKETQFVLKRGVPQPRKETRKEKRQKTIVASIGIVDWVTGESLWHADIISEKPGATRPPDGPRTQIYARGLSPAELALKITNTLRRYVEALQRTSGASPNVHP